MNAEGNLFRIRIIPQISGEDDLLVAPYLLISERFGFASRHLRLLISNSHSAFVIEGACGRIYKLGSGEADYTSGEISTHSGLSSSTHYFFENRQVVLITFNLHKQGHQPEALVFTIFNLFLWHLDNLFSARSFIHLQFVLCALYNTRSVSGNIPPKPECSGAMAPHVLGGGYISLYTSRSFPGETLSQMTHLPRCLFVFEI